MRNDEATQEVMRDGKQAAAFILRGLVKESRELTEKAIKAMEAYTKEKEANAKGKSDIRGEQRIEDLSAKNTDKSILEVKGKIDGFDEFAKEYGIDYAAVYDKNKDQTILVFQSKDNATLDKAFQNYLDSSIKKDKTPIVEKVSNIEAAQGAAPGVQKIIDSVNKDITQHIGKAVEAGAKVVSKAVTNAEHTR